MIKAVSFDFDGVFVRDSDAVFKNDAWKCVLKPFTGKYEEYLKEAKNKFGHGKRGGREDIFKYVYERLGVVEGIDQLVEESSFKFNKYLQEHILEAGLVKNTKKTLIELSDRNIKIFLNSGTTDDSLIESVSNLGIVDFFDGIYGSSDSKLNNLKEISKRYNIRPQQIIVVGDSDSDRESSDSFGCLFIGVSNVWNEWSLDSDEFIVTKDIIDILGFI